MQHAKGRKRNNLMWGEAAARVTNCGESAAAIIKI